MTEDDESGCARGSWCSGGDWASEARLLDRGGVTVRSTYASSAYGHRLTRGTSDPGKLPDYSLS